MRTVIVFASALLSGVALADVRHVSVPEWLWGTWAPSAELCRDDKSIVVMSEKSYMTSQANCTVQWLTGTAAADEPIYSALMRCSLPSASEHETESNQIIVLKGIGQLSIGADFNDLKSYQRCPGQLMTASTRPRDAQGDPDLGGGYAETGGLQPVRRLT